MSSHNVPKYRVVRIFLTGIFLYFFLVLPVLLVLAVKMFPDFMERTRTDIRNQKVVLQSQNGQNQVVPSDSLLQLDSLPAIQPKEVMTAQAAETVQDSLIIQEKSVTITSDGAHRDPFIQTFSLLIRYVVLLSVVLGLATNAPFKRYFRRRRKGKLIPQKLFRYCKRLLLITPFINAGILFFTFTVIHAYMIYVIMQPGKYLDELNHEFFIQFFYVSLVASILSVLFVYFWQKHRVHIWYIEHIYSKEELRKRVFGMKVGRIKNRLWVSAGMTTFLPLVVVVFYLFASQSAVREIGSLNSAQVKVLMGDYSSLVGDQLLNKYGDNLYYVNALDNATMFLGIGAGILISFIYILFFVKWTTADIVSPVKELLDNIKRTGDGQLNNYTIVRTNDEIGELTEGYNEMSTKLKDYFYHISHLNEIYSRFVPKQFLEFLDKESLVDIELGDQVEKEMTVLFSDIRGFTELSEAMTPKENFDFINNYLGVMEPVIHNHQGFIDKYIGDSIMALFGTEVDNAIDAAIEMRSRLIRFNEQRMEAGLGVIDSGIGIHTGDLMLGIVGGQGRMDSTVISDAVNLASRLEGLTKIYGCSIIISQDTLIKAIHPENYTYRFLDVVKVKGKREAVYIFEILDGEPAMVRDLKIETKTEYMGAIEAYKAQRFDLARKTFESIRKINPHDKVVDLYIHRCKHILKTGVPEDWDGVQVMDNKY